MSITIRPSCMTNKQHREAEKQGWSIFQVDRDGESYGEVQRIDELEILDDDEQATPLARKSGLVVLDSGRVLARWIEQPDGLLLQKVDEPLPMTAGGEVDLRDEHLVEGLKGVFEQVLPEDCGGLTDGLILSREVERNDSHDLSKITKLGDVFWDDNYMVRNLWDQLNREGMVKIRRVVD